jgi:hypothetical protein
MSEYLSPNQQAECFLLTEVEFLLGERLSQSAHDLSQLCLVDVALALDVEHLEGLAHVALLVARLGQLQRVVPEK